MKIRLVKEEDAPALLEIYAPYIKNTVITFEYEVPSIEEFRQRIKNISEKYPWIVCEYDNEIVGYAYASEHRKRAAYGWSVDLSVYVDQSYHRIGIGTLLYSKLFSILKLMGYYNAYGGVTIPNMGSEKLHETMGFQAVGVYHNVGYKFDRWHDVKWFELSLKSHEAKPEKPKNIDEIISTPEFNRIMLLDID